MIERGQDAAGELSPKDSFAAVYVACLKAELTGHLVIWDEDRACDGKIAFRDGHPFHVGGEAFEDHPLGRVLSELGSVDTGDIEFALEAQKSEPAPPLLGDMLNRELVLDDDAIEGALEIQTKRRLLSAFDIRNGMWRCEWAKKDDFARGGAPMQGWAVLIPGVRESATDRELRRLTDDLLGHAVKLSCSVEEAHKYGHDAGDESILIALEKPRKPDQLERELSDRKHVRGVLLALHLAGVLERLPAQKGVPFPKTPRRSKSSGGSAPKIERVSTAAPAPAPAPETKSQPKPPPKPSPEALQLADDIKRRCKDIDDQSHFEVLGATESTSTDALRTLFAELVRSYHPDKLTQLNLPKDVVDKAAELSTRLNDSYATLTDPKRRSEYLRLYHDSRIKGSSRKEAQVKDTETKFKMGMVLLKKRSYSEARALLQTAAEADPTNGTYKAYLAWAMWTDPSLLIDVVGPKVLELLEEATKHTNTDAQAFYFYGAVLKVRGDLARAQKMFKKTLNIDPRHVEATRELRLMRMRQKR